MTEERTSYVEIDEKDENKRKVTLEKWKEEKAKEDLSRGYRSRKAILSPQTMALRRRIEKADKENRRKNINSQQIRN